jgi:hypothetical protein
MVAPFGLLAVPLVPSGELIVLMMVCVKRSSADLHPLKQRAVTAITGIITNRDPLFLQAEKEINIPAFECIPTECIW